MLGAAAGSLVAASSSLPVAVGAVWLGVAGGAYPDWLDLRSELKGSMRLRHRGASHGLPMALLVTSVVFFALSALANGSIDAPGWMRLAPHTVDTWTVAFAAGIATHLLGDACTHAGIRPLLPFLQWRFWLLPKVLRGRSDGFLNTIALLISFAVLGFSLVLAVARATDWFALAGWPT